jgi:hypothetical protein
MHRDAPFLIVILTEPHLAQFSARRFAIDTSHRLVRPEGNNERVCDGRVNRLAFMLPKNKKPRQFD